MQEESKNEEEFLHEYEEFFYRCFKIIRNPDRYCYKKITNFEQYCFMSKRFYLLYYSLLKKYPELDLQKDIFLAEQNIPNKSTLYINDFIAEMPRKIKVEDKILLIFPSSFSCIQNIYQGNDLVQGTTIIAPWIHTRNDLKEMKKDSKISKSIKKKTNSIMSLHSMHKNLDVLGSELQLLKKDSIDNSYDLAPVATRKYFQFIFDNVEQIRYYIHSFYNLKYERDVKSVPLPSNFIERVADNSEKTRNFVNNISSFTNPKILCSLEELLIQEDTTNQTKEHFKEETNNELLVFLQSILPSYYQFLHYPIEVNIKEVNNRLKLLSEEEESELASELYLSKQLKKRI